MRKPVVILLMLAFMAVWVWGAATIGSLITEASGWLQLVFYIIAGVGWVIPLRPLFLWMNANQPPEEE
jgi:hypothetical protein